jgi:hypothetical protein
MRVESFRDGGGTMVPPVLRKLGAANRTEAVTRARELGLILTRSDAAGRSQLDRAHAAGSFGK